MHIWKIESIPDLAFDGLTGVEYKVSRKAICAGNKSFWVDSELPDLVDYLNDLERHCAELENSLKYRDLQETMRDSSIYGQ